ncbi:acyltransferase family protein [Leeuwenhoekiella aestuarii]|uniref:Peptidoglycan/LPS O-acetylase OafA/YrhL n=1 Tax=Leeuwenhoekiella aestuarii TaxID=2249426 RepID=A0A4Q0NR27_9FLAO|nr:acyltransferase [Leeuwenhoekiella aestuarii]RXG13092.1 peptidoglycan/LPS O-acetylase OafA/YrhL [Leeuwenhoekiella aestuarii]
MSNTKGKLVKLEAIRGFAALYVVIYHLFLTGIIQSSSFIVNTLFRFGQEAVILFFVLSGFVIKYSHERASDKSFFTYFEKRFLRIFIPLILVFLTNYFLFSYQDEMFLSIDWKQFFGNLFMFQDVGSLKPNVIVNPFLGNTPLWSLSYEWWFYMLFFGLYFLKPERATKLVYVLAVLSAISYLFYPNFLNRLLMYLLIWWGGLLIADLFLKNEKISFSNLRNYLFVMLLIAALLLLNVFIQGYTNIGNIVKNIGIHPVLELRHFIFAILAITLALCWHKLNWVFFRFTFLPFYRLAPISYALYISHWFLVIKATYLNDYISNIWIRTFIYLLLCFVFSYLVEEVIYVYFRKLIVGYRKTLTNTPN